MESWNHIINTALLGTEKRELKKTDVDANLAEHFELIAQHANSKEDAFLQTASFIYNYRQCGILPLHKEGVSITKAEEEEKQYANAVTHQTLYDIIETGSISLLNFWLEQCAGANKIVQPEVIPVLLESGMKHKQLQTLVYNCCGKRGAWLIQFNNDWKYAVVTDEEELWQTGTLEQRKNILAQVRKINPAKAREMLQQVWAQENAAAKAELVSQLAINAGEEDVPWLEELLNEKSTKVKEAALEVLKTIPSSTIVQKYWNVLQQSIRLTTSKGLLGIGSKTVLEIKLTDVDKAIFKTGIEQLSNQKNISDENFILYQLISAVPPHFWKEHFHLTSEKIIELFLKDDKSSYFVSAFGLAAARFKNLEWMRTVIAKDTDKFYPGAIDLFSQKEAETYALKFLTADDTARNIINTIQNFSKEWSIEFSKAVLRFTAKNPYQFHRGFYNNIIHLLPVPVIGELEKCTPKEEHFREMWSNMGEHIIKLLTLKLQTLKAFNE